MSIKSDEDDLILIVTEMQHIVLIRYTNEGLKIKQVKKIKDIKIGEKWMNYEIIFSRNTNKKVIDVVKRAQDMAVDLILKNEDEKEKFSKNFCKRLFKIC